MMILIEGEPIAQARPRFYRRGKHVGAYNPQETEAGKWLLMAKSQIKEKLTGPLDVLIVATFKRPDSHYGSGKNRMILKNSAPRHCTNKKDADNLAKFVLDCLNGHAWDDDRQIVSLNVIKRWAQNWEGGKTTVSIMESAGF